MAELKVPLRMSREARYEIPDKTALDVVIQRQTDEGSEMITGQVIELSRGGAKLSISSSIPFEEMVRLQIQSRDEALAMDVEAKICWGRPGPGDTWLTGCKITPQIDDAMQDCLAAAGYIDRRDVERTAIFWKTTVQWELQTNASPVTLTNLSDCGFGMQSSYSAAVGQRLLLHVDGPHGTQLALPAQVEWTSKAKKGHSVGCRLLNPEDMQHLKRVAKKARWRTGASGDSELLSSTWVFIALLLFAFFGPSLVYGLFRTLAPTGDSPPEEQIESAIDSDPMPAPVDPEESPVDDITPPVTDAVPEPEQAPPLKHAGEVPEAMPATDAADTVATPEHLATEENPSAEIAPPAAAETQSQPTEPAPTILSPEPASVADGEPAVLTIPPAYPFELPPAGSSSDSVTGDSRPRPAEKSFPIPPRTALLPPTADDPTPRTKAVAIDAAGPKPDRATRRDPVDTRPPPRRQPSGKPNAADARRADMYFEESYNHFRQGQLQHATESLQKAHALYATNPLYLYVGAIYQYQTGEVDAALRMVARGAELERAHPIDNWGRAVRRFQGRSRVWLETARSQALSPDND